MSETPEEFGRRLAEAMTKDLNKTLPLIQRQAALLVCLQQLIGLLIAKSVLDPQEVLSVLSRASDEIQLQPQGEVGVQVVESLCSFVEKLGGATRPSA
jgi:hypothetical protein